MTTTTQAPPAGRSARSDAGAPYTNRRASRGVFDPQAWAPSSACRRADVDPELFFHPEGETGRARRTRESDAKKVCADCPVRALCLDYALERREQYGVWGGTGEEERAALLRVRRGPREGKKPGGAKPLPVTQDDVETIRRMHGEGRNQREIADHLGWSYARMPRAMQSLGISARAAVSA
ncbi:WhiB family transcriptional regulator [Cellulosimicrobium sp. NPDC057862]|uniref:WhiB family transcriptional regulator n=1 Tax=Actinomycetes TaxID=1760 RepID=UPI0036709FEE